jgi:TMEM175 potassium channel family protein
VNRLHALTDGVYAIAMTLLVLELHVPDARSSAELVTGLVSIAPSLFGFALGFAVLGTYWVGSAVNLSHLARVNRAALFLNVLQLFFISLLPFTTALIGRYPDEAAAVIVYALHLELLGLSQYAHWIYVLRHPELVHSPIDARTARTATIRILVGPAAWAVAMLLALVSPRLGYAVFYVVLVGYLVASVRDRTVVR